MKALVVGNSSGASHDSTVRSHFLSASSSSWTCDIALIGGVVGGNVVYAPSSMEDVITYAIDNSYKILIRSYTSIGSYNAYWNIANENGIVVVHAHGSNNNTDLSYSRFFNAIGVGGGVTTNDRSYGLGLDVYDATLDNQTEESWATGVIGGRVSKIIENNPSYNVWDVRQHLRQTASTYANGWSSLNGYGRGTDYAPVASLDQAPPLSFSKMFSSEPNIVTFSWTNFKQTDFIKSEIVFGDEIIYSGTAESFSWEATTSGDLEFRIRSIGSTTSNNESFCSVTALGVTMPVDPVVLSEENNTAPTSVATTPVNFAGNSYGQGLPINDNKNNLGVTKMGGNSKDKLKYFLETNWKAEQAREASQQEAISAQPFLMGENLFAAKVKVTNPFPYKGIVSFVNGSVTATGVGTEFSQDGSDYDIGYWQDFCLSSDPTVSYYVSSILSDTVMILDTAWTGETMSTQIFGTSNYSCTASGKASFVLGKNNSATGTSAVVLAGYGNRANSDHSVVMGENSLATGQYSLAAGRNAWAKGAQSMARGVNTVAHGFMSYVEGDSSWSIGISSHAEGMGTTAVGDYSHSQGRYSHAGGLGSFASGYSCSAEATNSSTLAGSANTIISSATNSSILAGQNITATAQNTAYTNNIEITSASGVILTAQNGSRYRLTVTNAGSLTALLI